MNEQQQKQIDAIMYETNGKISAIVDEIREIRFSKMVESEKLTEISDKKVNRKKVCEALISSYTIQTMDRGIFHADPHPGNLGF